MANRRTSRINQVVLQFAVKLWQIRVVLLLAISYLILLGWLFSGPKDSDIRVTEALTVPELPLWKKPDEVHWFGTMGNGADLFQVTRRAMATSVATAVIISGIGVALGFLIVTLFAFDPGSRKFSLLKSMERAGFLIPGMVALVIVAGGALGSLISTAIAFSLLIAVQLSPRIATWFETDSERPDMMAGYALGLNRSDMIRSRTIPGVIRRLIGAFAGLIPMVVLAEMGLSFLGLAGERLSCGAIVAFGQRVIIEAPWVAVCPGILAAAVVMVLSLLGMFSTVALKSERLPRLW